MFKFFRKENDDHIQSSAWRLVRSAEDRMSDNDGSEKMAWAVTRLQDKFKNLSTQDAEDFIRSAYINLTIETGTYQRRLPRL